MATLIIKYQWKILFDLNDEYEKPSTLQQCVKHIGVCYANIYYVIKYYFDCGSEKIYLVVEVLIRTCLMAT